jgi:hypothetical protein
MSTRTIPLKRAFDILLESTAVVIDGNVLLYPSLDQLTGEDENEFLYVGWEYEGLEYNIRFVEENNREVLVENGTLILKDSDDDEVRIQPLVEMKID